MHIDRATCGRHSRTQMATALAGMVIAVLALVVSVRPAAAQLGGYYYWRTFPEPEYAQFGGVGEVHPSQSPLNPWIFTPDAGIYRWDGNAWRFVSSPPGSDWVNLGAVDSTGQPWVVTTSNVIWRRLTTSYWQKMPGAAITISTGADGSVWITGTNDLGGGNKGIYRWTGSDWQAISGGGGTRVKAGPDGSLRVIKADQSIWHVTFSGASTAWSQMPGAASDIAVASDGTVWIIGTDTAIYKWSGSAWMSIGSASSGSQHPCFIAVGGRSDVPVITLCSRPPLYSRTVKQRLWRSY
jgi:hypothetical protein